ncbi:Ku protein [Streptomyces nigrescens]|uniref:non-homologous end joining protein Ku n=1 Tax=Streptomyces nigrescens TaxID=1920 RepID=UPI0021C2A700|nr:Ku protein [Streptomyces nigrescens]
MKIFLSFGLVTIPVAVYSAFDPTARVAFVRIHTKDTGRVRNQPVCSREGVEVPLAEIGRGYPTDRGVVPLTDRDLEALPIPTAKTLTILAFVAGEDIDPLLFGRGHYLAADGPQAVKPYVLLRDAMERHRRVGLGKVALYGRETLAMVRPLGAAMAMQELLWPHQIRSMTGVLPHRQVSISAKELAAAEELMDSYGPLQKEDVQDRFRAELEELAAAKLAEREPHFAGEAEPAPSGPVADLMGALQASVARARAARGEDEEAPAPLMPPKPQKQHTGGQAAEQSEASGGDGQ